MKKLVASLMVVAMMLTACATGNQKDGSNSNFNTEAITMSEDFELQKLDYVVSDKTSDLRFAGNCVNTLLENDRIGKLVPSLAKEWSSNNDKTVWTFKLREGVKWYTNTAEEYPKEVTSEDFVTALRHAADFKSNTAWLLNDLLKNYKEYSNSKLTDEDWNKVGIKTPDKYTVVYELTKPAPYFATMTTYLLFAPVQKDFLESRGEGCKLGNPDPKKCDFGTANNDSILYCGPYILTKHQAKSEIELVKNDNYWDKENVHIASMKTIYVDGSDQYEAIRGFEAGIYPGAGLIAAWKDYDVYLEKYKKYAFLSDPNATTFGTLFNMNRKKFEHTNYAKDETLRKNTRAAVLNENFRKAYRAAFDAVAWLGSNAPEVVAKAQIRNINNFPDAGTSKNGTYFELVEKAYADLTGEHVKLDDGQYPWLNKEKALAYIEAAKKDGIVFPIHLDIPVADSRKDLVNKANSIAQSVKENTNGQIVVEPVLMDRDSLSKVAYQLSTAEDADYDISTFSGWNPDFADPKSFCDIFDAETGPYMKNMGLGEKDKDKDIKEKIGLTEYTKLIRAADAINTDLDARYEAYAKADAFLIDKGFFLPNSQQTRGMGVSRFIPYQRVYSPYGISSVSYKGAKLQATPVTAEARMKAYEAWEKERSEAAKK